MLSAVDARALQLHDEPTSTYTYLVYDRPGGAGLLIDPVDTKIERDLAHVARLGLTLVHVLETHVHADHVTSAGALRARTRASVIVPANAGVAGADREVGHGDAVAFGGAALRVLATPGHTAGSVSYVDRTFVFTGDALLIDGCGRTDFQDGDAGTLYDSVTGRLFTLPDDMLVFPAHDYHGQQATTIGHERRHNARFAGRSRSEFVALMASLDLPMPRLIDVAVPANRRLGAR